MVGCPLHIYEINNDGEIVCNVLRSDGNSWSGGDGGDGDGGDNSNGSDVVSEQQSKRRHTRDETVAYIALIRSFDDVGSAHYDLIQRL